MTAVSKFVAAAAVVLVLGLGLRAFDVDELDRHAEPGVEPVAALELAESASRERAAGPSAVAPDLGPTPPTRSSHAPPPSAATPVRGVLVDAESGDPSPYYALGIGTGEAVPYTGPPEELPPFAERVLTDHAGRFETSGSFEPGAMHAVLLEEFELVRAQSNAGLSVQSARPALEFEHVLSPAEGVQLTLAMGPSYFVQCSALTMDTCAEYVAHLKSREPERTTYTAAGLVHCIGPAGPSYLARFPPAHREWRMPDEAEFELLHVAQRRAGRVAASTRKVWPYPTVRVDLVPIGSLAVRVDSDQGAPPDSVRLDVWRGAIAASELDNRPLVVAGRVASRGVYETLFARPSQVRWAPRLSARRLETGPYTIRVCADGFDDWIGVHTIEEGPNELVCTMHRNVLADGWIAGTVHTDSDAAPADRWVVYLTREDPKGRAEPKYAAVEVAEEGGRWIGRFRAEALVPGNYDVWIVPAPDMGRDRVFPNTTPRLRGVDAGRGDLRFDIQDEARTFVLEVSVLNAQGGEPISEFTHMLVKKESDIEVDPRPFADGLARLELASDLSSGFVGVAAEGFAAEYELAPALPDQDGVFRMRLRLVDGWGAPVSVLTLVDGKEIPIADAEVLVDGSVVGKTDELGLCVLRLATRPTTLVARRAGYSLERSSGPIDAAGRLGTPRAEPFRDGFAFIMRPE